MRMRALTLWPEWPPTFLYMDKTLENRTWPPPEAAIGERIALHAGASIGGGSWKRGQWLEDTAWDAGWNVTLERDPLMIRFGSRPLGLTNSARRLPIVLGAVVATTCLVGAKRIEELPPDTPWAFGPWCWMFKDIQPLAEPVPMKGHQGLWWCDLEAA